LHFIRRDLAKLAYLCVAPEKGSPSPLAEVLTDGGSAVFEVKKLWDKPVDNSGLGPGGSLLAQLER